MEGQFCKCHPQGIVHEQRIRPRTVWAPCKGPDILHAVIDADVVILQQHLQR